MPPDIDGLQVECSVADVINPDDAPPSRTEKIIPASTIVNAATGLPDASTGCGSAPIPCYGFKANDTMQCPATATNPDSISIEIFRNGASVDAGTVLEVQCVTL
jgi:hypothetical protein